MAGRLILERISTSELKQCRDEQFDFHIWLALRKRQWKSQRCERRIARHSVLEQIRVEQKKEQEAKEAELRQIRRIETDRVKALVREEATPLQSTAEQILQFGPDVPITVAKDVRKRAAELAEWDKDDKAGEPPGFRRHATYLAERYSIQIPVICRARIEENNKRVAA